MTKTHASVLTALALLLVLAPVAQGFTALEARQVVTAGGRLTVDNRFTPADVLTLVAAGGTRVTVLGRGFAPGDVRSFLAAGAALVIDGTMPSKDLLDVASIGRARVTVDPAGLAPDVLRRVVSAGANLMAGTGGNTFAEKMQTVQNGGQAAVDASYSVRDVSNIVAVGRVRVHVMGKGFKPGDLQLFAQMGAIVWVDVTTPSPEIMTLASTGASRIVVRSSGFKAAELIAFAQRGAQIVMAFDRDSTRAAKFDLLHGADAD